SVFRVATCEIDTANAAESDVRAVGCSSHIVSRVENVFAMAATTHAVVDNQRQHNFTRGVATICNVLRPPLAYHAVATHSIPGIAATVAVMSRCTARLLATMISRSQTKAGRKREWWFRLRAIQKSYRVIQRANTFVCASEYCPATNKPHRNNSGAFVGGASHKA